MTQTNNYKKTDLKVRTNKNIIEAFYGKIS